MHSAQGKKPQCWGVVWVLWLFCCVSSIHAPSQIFSYLGDDEMDDPDEAFFECRESFDFSI